MKAIMKSFRKIVCAWARKQEDLTAHVKGKVDEIT
jgi:hypothetical protein